MEYQIEEWPAFTVAGYATKVKTKEAFQVVPKIWNKAWRDGTMERLIELIQLTDYRPAGFLGIVAGGQKGQEQQMDYILGVTNYVNVPDCTYVAAKLDMQEFSYPAAKWVIVNADGELPEAVQKIYREFYHGWLPSSGYELADLPVIEAYLTENRQEVWFAVK